MSAQRDYQIVDPAGGDSLDVGLHDHRVQGDVDPASWRQQRGKNDPVRVLGIFTFTSPTPVVTTLSRVPLRRVIRASGSAARTGDRLG